MSVSKDKKTGKYYYNGKYKTLSGKTVGYKKRGFDKKKDCQKAEVEFLRTVTNNYDRMLLDDLVKLYGRNSMALGIKEATVIGDESYYNNHIKDVFGQTYIDKIDTRAIEGWKMHMITKPKLNKQGEPTNGRYAVNTINHAQSVLSKYLSYAVYMGMLQYNTAKNVKKYHDPNREAETNEDAEENFLELDEFKQFIAAVDDPLWNDIFYYLFNTGVREGEFFALRWKKINFDVHKIKVNKSITSKTKQKGVIETTTKTKRSDRIIDMQKSLEKRLQIRYEYAQRLDGFNGNYFVFGDIRPISSTTLARRLEYYLDKSNTKRITPHGFRHSHAAMLINAGIDDSLIAERLGHTVEELRKTYAHLYKRRRKSLVEELDNIYDDIHQ